MERRDITKEMECARADFHQLLDTATSAEFRAREIHDSGGGVDVRTDRRLGGSRRHWPASPLPSGT